MIRLESSAIMANTDLRCTRRTVDQRTTNHLCHPPACRIDPAVRPVSGPEDPLSLKNGVLDSQILSGNDV